MKRSMGDELGMGEDLTKKTKVDGEVVEREKKEFEARFLIEKRSMGLIIGKGGARIKAMQEEAGVYASILKVDAHSDAAPERVMVLQGSCQQIAHAVRSISQLIVDNAIEREQKNNPTGEISPETSIVKMTVLFDLSQAGAIIGKAGTTIKQTQAETGAKMQVSKEPLTGSTERSCQITGAVDIVESAMLAVLQQLKDYPATNSKSIHYVPTSGLPPPSPYGADPYGGFGAIGQSTASYGSSFQSPFGTPSVGGMSFAGQDSHFSNGPSVPAVSDGPTAKQQIAIPTSCAGGVIGKGGRCIREIQAHSGTTIQIAAADPASPHERIVTISGPSSGITTAVALIRQAVEQEYPRLLN